jgi:hypothetical protein
LNASGAAAALFQLSLDLSLVDPSSTSASRLRLCFRKLSFRQHFIRLEEDQTKNSEARTIPLPNVLVEMLKQVDKSKAGFF